MKTIAALIVTLTFIGAAPVPQPSKAYIGIVSDSMCRIDHKSMGTADERKCVLDCVGDGKTYKFALVVGNDAYLLSDQQTPAKFAGQKVRVTGVLYAKTKILKVDKIEAVK